MVTFELIGRQESFKFRMQLKLNVNEQNENLYYVVLYVVVTMFYICKTCLPCIADNISLSNVKMVR